MDVHILISKSMIPHTPHRNQGLLGTGERSGRGGGGEKRFIRDEERGEGRERVRGSSAQSDRQKTEEAVDHRHSSGAV